MKRVYGISRIALSGLLHKPLRSFLTMLTAAIGIASVVATVSIVNGANEIVRSSLTKLGTNIIVVQGKGRISGGVRKPSNAMSFIKSFPIANRLLKKEPLDISDVNNLEREFYGEDVLVSPAIIIKLNVRDGAADRELDTTVIGTDRSYFRMIPIPMAAGRIMNADEIARGDKVCVLDETTVYKTFSSETKPGNVLGKSIRVSGKNGEIELKVVGVLENPHFLRRKDRKKVDLGTIARDVQYSRLEFMNVYVPFKLLENNFGRINTIFVMPAKIDEVEPVKKHVAAYMSGANKNVLVWDQKTWIFATLDAVEEFSSFTHYIWVMILGVAMIMIVTITLVSVRERYCEIAIRITEGATKFKIIMQFAIESLYVSIAGGIVGIMLGYLIIAILERLVIRWDAIVSYREILMAFGLSILIGILTSIPTAKHAASLNPVDVFRMR